MASRGFNYRFTETERGMIAILRSQGVSEANAVQRVAKFRSQMPRPRKPNPELESKREAVFREQAKASRKIARNRREKGVDLFGTSQDPRVSFARIAKLTAKQLEAHERRLREFNSRKTQFVPGTFGQPIPKAKWDKYKALENQHNAIGNQRMNERGHLKAPGSGMTIKDREDSVRSKIKARGSVTNRPYNEISRDSMEVNGAEKLDKLIKDLEKKNKKSFIPKNLKEQREQLNQMLKEIGMGHRIDEANALSDYRFDVLFNDTNFTNTVSQKYWIIKAQESGQGKRSDQAQIDNADSAINDFFDWIHDEVPERPENTGNVALTTDQNNRVKQARGGVALTKSERGKMK